MFPRAGRDSNDHGETEQPLRCRSSVVKNPAPLASGANR